MFEMRKKWTERTMKSTVFARPNLKAFLLGAILIAVVQNFIANGNSQATLIHSRGSTGLMAGSENDLQQLLRAVEKGPTSQLYSCISRCYEKQGDMRKALFYLRKAQVLAQIEEAND
jgi:hypothetical protein